MFANFISPQQGTNPLPNLLFDQIINPALGGFSLRKLTNSYSGPCLQVRRGGDDAIENIYFKNDGTLDTQAIVNFCGANSGFVRIWWDQSANGDWLYQPTFVRQPKIYDSVTGIVTQNGKPALYFDGTNDWMYAQSGALTFGTPPLYTIVVLRYTETGTNGGIVTGKAQFTDASQAIDANTSDKYDIDDDVYVAQSTTSVGTYDLVSATWRFPSSPGNKKLWINGGLEATANYAYNANSRGRNSVGVTRYNDTNYGQMFLQEWVFWGFYASDADNTYCSTLVNNYYSAY